MRDPARIDIILAALGAYWRSSPDLRLAQIVGNAHGKPTDSYQMEDSVLLDYLSRQAVESADSARYPANGWHHPDHDVDMDDVYVETSDWVWCDPDGRVRRHYGFAGGSYLKVHTFDARGDCLVGIECRDDPSFSEADIHDHDNAYPKARALAESLPIDREEDDNG